MHVKYDTAETHGETGKADSKWDSQRTIYALGMADQRFLCSDPSRTQNEGACWLSLSLQVLGGSLV